MTALDRNSSATVRVYYNEFDRYAAEWLRQLIRDGLIPGGWVDERSIAEVQPEDLEGYQTCHFFAGIGGWPYALRLAGWTGPVWTGSCPCQPFSQAGKRLGDRDARNLWPEFRRLVEQCRPSACFGEQVASKDGRHWLSGVRSDLEAVGYRVAAADLCAAGVSAPHIRQRLYWVADQQGHGTSGHSQKGKPDSKRNRCVRRLADGDGRVTRDGGLQPSGQFGQQQEDRRSGERLGHPDDHERNGPVRRSVEAPGARHHHAEGDDRRRASESPRTGDAGRPWRESFGLLCSDGKTRRVGTGLHPLAHGIPDRVGLIRGYGNAIVPALAAEFVQAYQETCFETLTPPSA